MTIKSQKANQVLDQHLQNLNLVTNVQQGNNWKASLKDTLNLYIGKDSAISNRLNDLYFTSKVTRIHERAIGGYNENVYSEVNKENFKTLIENAKQFITANGIYRNPNKKNFLGSFSNVEVIGGLFVVGTIVFSIGTYIGKLNDEREIVKYENEKKENDKRYDSLVKVNKSIIILQDKLPQNKMSSDTTKPKQQNSSY